MSLYHAAVYFGRRNGRDNLYYSMLVFSFALVTCAGLYRIHTGNMAMHNELSRIFIMSANSFCIWCIFAFSCNALRFVRFRKSCIAFYMMSVVLPCIAGIIYGSFGNNFRLADLTFMIPSVLFCLFYWSLATALFLRNRKYRVQWQRIIYYGFSAGLFFYLFYFLLIILKFNGVIQLTAATTGFLIFSATASMAINLELGREYSELKNIKGTLESKVTGRTAKLKKATEAINTLNEERMNFFVNFIHETKTPLTLIGNYITRLSGMLKDVPADEFKRIFRIVQDNFEKIQKDIVNYFDLENLYENRELYSRDEIHNLRELVEKKVELFSQYAGERKIEINTDLDDILIKINPSVFDRIINNLLDNAVKYNKEYGRILIKLKNENNEAILQVIDSGIGIGKDQLEDIFKPFYKSARDNRDIHGMGVGLSILKNFVSQINGRIEVISTLNEGSEFKIIFPDVIRQNDPDKKTADTICMPETRFNKNLYTVLIIEDDIDLLNYLVYEFRDIFNIYTALNGNEALSLLPRINRPDVMISDIMMDPMNGFEFCREIKKIAEYKDIPLVFLSAKSSKEEKSKGYLCGAVDFIEKPFKINELYLKIEKIIENYMLTKKTAAEEMAKEKEKKLEELIKKNKITRKEREIINILKLGKENKEIAIDLQISEQTVKNHMKNIFNKTHIKTRTELIKKFS